MQQMTQISLLEEAFEKIQSRVDAVLSAASHFVRSAKGIRSAADLGNVANLQKAADESEQHLASLSREFLALKDSSQLDIQSYLASPRFAKEVSQMAADHSLPLFEMDGKLYCYPVVIQIIPGASCVRVGSVREKNLRPSRLVEQLKHLHSRPPRFTPEVFLEYLFKAYDLASSKQHNREVSSPVVPLRELYGLLTPLPGQSSEYSLDEFTVDVYLLDRSGVVQTEAGAKLCFHSSTGGRSLTVLSVVTVEGTEKQYSSISFAR